MAKVLLHKYGPWLRTLAVLAILVGSAMLIRTQSQIASADVSPLCTKNLKIGIIIDRSNSVAQANGVGAVTNGVKNFITKPANHKANLEVGFWTFGTVGSGYVGENPLKTWQLSPTAPDIPAGQYPGLNFIRMNNAAHRLIFTQRVDNIPFAQPGVGGVTGSAGWTNWEVALGNNEINSPSNRPWVGPSTVAGANLNGRYQGVIATPPEGGSPGYDQRSKPSDANMVILITDNAPTVPRRRDNVGGNGEFFGWGSANGKAPHQAQPIDHGIDAARQLGNEGVTVNGIAIAPAPDPGEEQPPDPQGTRRNLEKITQANGKGGRVLETGFNAQQITAAIEQLINETCLPPQQPYLRVYGNDVTAGGGFITNGSCTPFKNDAKITANVARQVIGNSANWYGAASQLGVSALGPIEEFYSGSLRDGVTTSLTAPVNLTFGNTSTGAGKVGVFGPVNPNDEYPNVGGYSGQVNCIPDYFEDGKAKGADPEEVSVKTINSLPSEKVTYVEGDVHITDNIQYPTTSGWNSPNDIPNYMMVVKGNIFIAPNVTQLDGIYIAQPNGNSDGEIRTCANNNGSLPADCSGKLTINGAFIAKQVRFKRTNGNVNAAIIPLNEPADSTNIAEVFNFSPEAYLGPLDPTQARSLPYQKYQYITSLPPVL